MTREMEYAKCIAVLRKILRLGLLSEAEYMMTRNKIMSRYLIIETSSQVA